MTHKGWHRALVSLLGVLTLASCTSSPPSPSTKIGYARYYFVARHDSCVFEVTAKSRASVTRRRVIRQDRSLSSKSRAVVCSLPTNPPESSTATAKWHGTRVASHHRPVGVCRQMVPTDGTACRRDAPHDSRQLLTARIVGTAPCGREEVC